MAKTPPNSADYIVPLNMNGLQGRMLHLPAPKGRNREILLVYGHHSSLERWWGLAQVLNRYGAVTMPDLPGFGSMDSLYKIDKKPTIDNLADYLAAFVKMRYKRRRVTIIGMSFGFVIVTRMLQRFPELVKKVDLLTSLVGFAHKDDFIFSKSRYWIYRLAVQTFSTRLGAAFFHNVVLQPVLIRAIYSKTHNAKNKFQGLSREQSKEMIEVEIGLWRDNDARTYMFTTKEFLTFDNCKAHVDLPIYHVGVKNDHFFDNNVVEQHMRVIFSDFEGMIIEMTKHAPTVIADAKDAAPFVPPKLRRILSRPGK
jgi:pimeloyl-ACP methyl ester carboxylesterase